MWTGLDSLRILIVLDDTFDVDDKKQIHDVNELKSSIRDSLQQHGISLWPYTSIATLSELAETDEE